MARDIERRVEALEKAAPGERGVDVVVAIPPEDPPPAEIVDRMVDEAEARVEGHRPTILTVDLGNWRETAVTEPGEGGRDG